MSTIHQAASKLKGRKRKNRCNAIRALRKCPQKKGEVKKMAIMTPRKPNSARRTVVKIIFRNRRKVTARLKGKAIPVSRQATVLISGGRANDLPGVRFSMIKGKYDFSWREPFNRMNSRSKYGIKWDDYMWIVSEHLDKLDNPEYERKR